MNIKKMINKKRKNEVLSNDEITYIIDAFVKGEIQDYHMSALLMAICLNGMNEEETIAFTKAMIASGTVMDLSHIPGVKFDKHSTGGIGDKVTIALIPLLAATGLKIAKMSGRSLGHTGGTIDKLEAIEGFKVDLSNEEFINQVTNLGAAITSQTSDLVPADKKIYALRDSTATVESIPLVVASIMSKKIASGADYIIIDLKVGEEAFAKTVEEGRKMASLMVAIGKAFKKPVVCVLTNMNQPLGKAIGNGLEILESIDFLTGKGPDDLKNLVYVLATIMIRLGHQCSLEVAEEMIDHAIHSGAAIQKFHDIVVAQHGNIDHIAVSDKVFSIKSNSTGFLNDIDSERLGYLIQQLGAGRIQMEDTIDYGVGAVLNHKVGDFITENEELIKIYASNIDVPVQNILACFQIEQQSKPLEPLIYEIIST